MRPFTLGIVGTGVGIRTHLWGARQLGGAAVVGVVGSRVERARALLGDDADLALDLTSLLRRRPDVLAVTTPPLIARDQLAEIARADFGGRVLLEKPVLTPTPSSLDVVVDHQLRAHPLVATLARVLTESPLGPVRRITASEHSSRGAHQVVGWAADEAAGGGQAHAMATHLVDLVVALAGGRPADVTAKDRASRWLRLDPRSRVTDTVSWSATVDGVALTVMTSCVLPHARSLRVDVVGDGGTAALRHADGEGSLLVVPRAGPPLLMSLRDVVAQDADVDPRVAEEPSPFRVAYPFHLREVVTGGERVATGADGFAVGQLLQSTAT